MNSRKQERRGLTTNGFAGAQNTSYTGVSIGGRTVKVLVAEKGNVTSLHFNTKSPVNNDRELKTNVDYCDSAVNLICALEENSYEIVFLDYSLEHVDLSALLKFVRAERPNIKIVVTSAPVWSEQNEKDQVTSLCTCCCHESFYDLDVDSFVKSTARLKALA